MLDEKNMEHITTHLTNRHNNHRGLRHYFHAIGHRSADFPLVCAVLAVMLVLLWILIELAVVGGYALMYRVDDLMAALYMRVNPILVNFVIVSLVLIVIAPLIAMNFYEGRKRST